MDGLDSIRFREVMGRFPTGVTIVATGDGSGAHVGLTVSSFSSLSLDPPLVLVCIDSQSSSYDALVSAKGFTISILSESQEDLARRFAAQPADSRFRDHEWLDAPSGLPVAVGSTGWIDCDLIEVHTGGDHAILVGRVTAVGASDAPPLVFHRGTFMTFGP